MQARHRPFVQKNVPSDFPVPATSVFFNLFVSAKRFPDKTAIAYYGSRLSYAELLAQVEALAGTLQADCGVKRGDRVLLYVQNSPQFVIAYYAILRADAVVVPVNPMNMTEELKHYVSDAGASVAISGLEVLPRMAPLLGGAQGLKQIIVANYGDYVTAFTDLPVPDFVRMPTPALDQPGVIGWKAALSSGRTASPSTAGPDDLAAMPYTSGTTGKPKGCMHTHGTLMATISLAGIWSPSSCAEVALAVVPFFHVTGMQVVMNGTLYMGGELVIMTRWDRELAQQLIERHGVTTWTNIPTMVIDLFASPNLTAERLRSLNYIGGGGAAMPEAVAKRLFEFTGLQYYEGYGLSETAAPTHSQPWGRPKPQCLGVPVCNTEAMVINVETLKPLGPGEVGEIVSRGPQVFKGYWKSQNATEAAFVEIGGKTWFRTGDLARYDEEGYFFIVDRLKRMINASGYKIWPAEVEALMYGNPDIQEACVIGTTDPHRGETVKAVVVLKAAARGEVSEEAIIEWCKANMAAYKYPRIVEFAETLPKSATGKVMWRVLQEQENARLGTK